MNIQHRPIAKFQQKISESVAAIQRTLQQANVNPFQRETIPPKSSKCS